MAEHKREETASWDAREVRRAQAEHQQHRPAKKRKRRHINPFLYILFILVVSAILAEVGWLLGSDLCGFNKEPVTTTIQVVSEDSIKTIAKKLEDAGLIKYKWFFRFYAGLTDAKEDIGIGTYELNTDMDYNAMINGMRNSSGNMNADTVKVTIPEGYTVEQTIRLLAKNGVNTEENLMEAAKTAKFNYNFIDNNTQDISRLEGFLFPDTYDFYVNEKAANALNRMIQNFDRKMDDDRLELVETSGHSLKEIITIASLIEKETDGTDQTKIASVIYNRLNGPGDKGGTYGMLQVDASLLYALPNDHHTITKADMQLDSKYNLYKYAGLPPTAIANPGIASIDAALNPEKTDYYYYALGKDKKHRFFTSYNEHLNFVNSSEYVGN